MSEIEILPSETEDTALARVKRRKSLKPRAVIEIQGPGGTTELQVNDEELGALKAGQMYIGFYNLTGQLPLPEDFEGLGYKPPGERAAMGLPPSQRGQRLLEVDNSRPMQVNHRLALAPIHVRRARNGEEVLSAKLTFDRSGFVSHFAIGTRKDGVMMAGQFHKLLPTREGNGFSFGIKVAELYAALPEGQNATAIDSARTTRALPACSQEPADEAFRKEPLPVQEGRPRRQP